MSGSRALEYTILMLLWLSICSPVILPLNAEDVNPDVASGKVLDVVAPSGLAVCDNATLVCTVRPPATLIWWSRGDTNISAVIPRHSLETGAESGVSKLFISCVDLPDIGTYTCHSDLDQQDVVFDITISASVVEVQGGRGKVNNKTTLACDFIGRPLMELQWFKGDDLNPMPSDQVIVKIVNETLVESRLHFEDLRRKDNGTYHCTAVGPDGPIRGSVPLIVLDIPQVEKIDFVTAVGARRIYLNWTVNDWNEPVQQYFIQHMKNGSNQWTHYPVQISGGNTSYVVDNLDPDTAYMFRIIAKNAIGSSKIISSDDYVRTLDSDPYFVPEVTVNGVTLNSITIGWTSPPQHVRPHIQYYQLVLIDNGTRKEAIHPAKITMNLYLFVNLESAATYHFKVAACSEYTRQCGNYSSEVNGTTMDGLSSAPDKMTLICRYDNVSRASIVSVSWAPPLRPNGRVVRYNVVLDGKATFKNEKGVVESVHWEPKTIHVDENHHSVQFYDVIPPNTNYTARVSAVTRSRAEGSLAIRHCNMPATVPDRDKLTRFYWGKVHEQGRWLLKLVLPRVTERNGPICCYRVFLVRLKPQQSVADLPPPEDCPITTYQQVHAARGKGGAYVAEVFESDAVSGEVFLGDGQSVDVNNSVCQQCVGLRPAAPTEPPTESPTDIPSEGPTSEVPLDVVTQDTAETTQTTQPPGRRRRSDDSTFLPYDGELDVDSNYTGFVEVIVFGDDHSVLPAYSSYLTALNPGPVVVTATLQQSPAITFFIHLLASMGLIIVFLLVIALFLHLHFKRVNQRQGLVEMSLTTSFRYLCRSLRGGHGVLVSASPPDMSPISRSDLPATYLERHKDSDYGFQHEFELLPDRFADRTTCHSEARENLYKNRYPDIKAYDQTRVRLSLAPDGLEGSDYINANFVVGYKERKKFICAQGPMDNTVCDFWRMIWEQHLELILMLTNLEEYSKTKCAKYWPDESYGEKGFGDITVRHRGEKRYSDYIVRELVMSKTNGKKEEETRTIVQYHFLVWKDFMAPEHPSGILKFIKRMNEAYSLEKGPILIHCSAGVGRTGTLVALDSLLQQLHEEGQVAIFNTVCDLRHQRNFLVQSLKQYIFVYRALMEAAQYGDTEIKVLELKSTADKLRQRDNGKEKTKMEEDFEKASERADEWKPVSVGIGEENAAKNRSERVIPFDRNRVILTPMPARDHSTYINASFIESYDNSESFIITQDPLESTVADFWRMLSEQNISTLVMLSDLGDGNKKCLRYWPDDETMHDHVRVKYIQSESCPYYTRRELSVTNIKTDETVLVTQYQYNGWPTVEGEVPEVTRGLIELVDQTRASTDVQGPIAVHCHCGSDRSSMFVALSILVQQLRTEKRVDIFAATRKLKSQRQGMLTTFAQYEFLHRAIVNYADLHHLTDEPDA